MPDTADLTVNQGAEYTVTFTYCNPSEPPTTPPTPGEPINVTGWSALMQLREQAGGPILISLASGDGITVGTTDGTFAVVMTATQTAALTMLRALYDLLVTPPAGEPIRIVGGRVKISPAISVPA